MGKKYVIEVEDEPFEYQGTKYWPAAHIPRVFFDAEDLAEMDIYEEPEKETHELKVGDVCYIPGEYENNKLIVTRITGYTVEYMCSNGSLWSRFKKPFEEKAIFMYHSDAFSNFMKGDFT